MFEFRNLDYLTDGEIDLIIDKKVPENIEKGYVPTYKYKITFHGSETHIGNIEIRIGTYERLYYGGHIGYEIYEPYRGRSYASKACKLIKQVGIAHDLDRLIITCNPDNAPSKRTCEKAGIKLLEIVELPPDNDMYARGERQKCIYVWILND